jgi:hypothetical protein
MRRFEEREVHEALSFAATGGQALHLHRIIVNWARAPRCFVKEVEAGRPIAHLFDQDEARLKATAKRFGVNVLLVERRGEPGQHIDLCGGPLKKAVAACELWEEK